MQRQSSVKEAERAYKKANQSPFVKYCLTVVAVLLIAGTVFACLLFSTDFLYDVNSSSFYISTNPPSVTSVTSTVDIIRTAQQLPDNGSLLAGVTGDPQGNVQVNPSGTSGGTSTTYVPGSSMGTGNLVENIDGWLAAYDGPTIAGNYFSVTMPSDYQPGKWAMGEGAATGSSYCRNTYSDEDGKSLISTGSYGQVNNKGRYWVGVGPAVTNPNFVCETGNSRAVTPSDMLLPKYIDIVLVNKSTGAEVYVPCVIGDVKAHTGPTGIVQTGTHVLSGVTVAGHHDYSIIEFVKTPASVATALADTYEIKTIYVYE